MSLLHTKKYLGYCELYPAAGSRGGEKENYLAGFGKDPAIDFATEMLGFTVLGEVL